MDFNWPCPRCNHENVREHNVEYDECEECGTTLYSPIKQYHWTHITIPIAAIVIILLLVIYAAKSCSWRWKTGASSESSQNF